jgi:hypothetical protein
MWALPTAISGSTKLCDPTSGVEIQLNSGFQLLWSQAEMVFYSIPQTPIVCRTSSKVMTIAEDLT